MKSNEHLIASKVELQQVETLHNVQYAVPGAEQTPVTNSKGFELCFKNL